MLSPLTIRLAHPSDLAEVERLAERDTRPVPGGALLVAERDGAIQAALSLNSGHSIADPFNRTAELVELLRTHAEARKASPRPPLRRRRFTPRLAGGLR